MKSKILLVLPPFYTPWTPPLGIATLKAFLEQRCHSVRCFDLNTVPELWGMHHQYFETLQRLEEVSINDGYSKLWWILNAHTLACANGADRATCARLLETIIPLYGIRHDAKVVNALIPLVHRYFERLDQVINRFDLSDLAVVGTSTFTTSLASSLFILKKVKQKRPRVVTVMGGGIFADDLALGSDNLNTLVEEYPYVDHVVVGEGELLFQKLVQGEFADKRVVSIADLGGETLDIQEVPAPDFSDLDLASYYHLTVGGGRGCPFQCQFCSETVQWGAYRKKPMAQLVDQLVHLAQEYGNRTFFLADSLINPYVTDLAGELLERRANVLYDGFLRADKMAAERERVRLWARSGLYRVRLGVESGSARVLSLMNKKTFPEVISDVLKALSNAGIRTTTYWVVGFPGETEEDFRATLDFVQQHHRYIYELEAHPFYYHPYGQVGSRLHKCDSLYPDDVVRVIKFKQWEIADRQPTRRETYDRLRRISKFAAGLGLPNMYVMAERYRAEDRWHRLHPLVTEVYEGTRRREKARPVEVVAPEWGQQTSGAAAVWCYHAFARKKLDESTLAAALEQLVRYNETLQMRFQDGRYAPVSEDESQASRMLAVYHLEAEAGDDPDGAVRQIVERLAAEMRPERGASVRLALVNGGRPSCDVLLLAHRAIADGPSAALLFEDLVRIYEQLGEGRKVSLRPLHKTYTQYANELAAQGGATGLASPGLDAGESSASGVTLSLGKHLTERLFAATLRECGLDATAVFAGASLKSLASAAGGESLGVDATSDCRAIDPSLEYTVGALTRIARLPPVTVRDDDLLSGLRAVRRALRDAAPALRPHLDASEAGRVLLDLECLVDKPWLGSDEWLPQGFVAAPGGPRGRYLLEIAPIQTGRGIEVIFRYGDRADARQLVEGVASHLARQLAAVLDRCADYAAAQRFWRQEFDAAAPQLALESDQAGGAESGWSWLPCDFEKSVLEGVQSQSRADLSVVVLAAYGVLLSRLSGQEDVALIVSIGGEQVGTVGVSPLRLYPSWRLSFREFVRQVEQKVALAREHGALAFDVLTGEPAGPERSRPCPVFEVGYTFGEAGSGQEAVAVEKIVERYPALGRGPGLILAAARRDEGLAARFVYAGGRLGRATVEKMAAFLGAILAEVAGNADVRLGEIALDGDESCDAAAALAADVFDFG